MKQALLEFFISVNLVACLIYLLFCGCSTSPVTHGIPNFAQVEPGVWRGGQPTSEGWAYLKSLGVTNVVKLNLESEGSDAQAKVLGMTVWQEGLNLRQQLGLETIPKDWFENIIVALPAKGIYIHCEHGQDRTGLCVAIWRIKLNRDGWLKADAEKEMLAHGFHKELHGLWEFWEHYPPDR